MGAAAMCLFSHGALSSMRSGAFSSMLDTVGAAPVDEQDNTVPGMDAHRPHRDDKSAVEPARASGGGGSPRPLQRDGSIWRQGPRPSAWNAPRRLSATRPDPATPVNISLGGRSGPQTAPLGSRHLSTAVLSGIEIY